VTRGKRGDFPDERTQEEKLKLFGERFKSTWTIQHLLRRDGFGRDHNRVGHFEVRSPSGDFKFYQMHLGYGLKALSARTATNSHGVLFETPQSTFESEWTNFESST
jgi:hypothetical protein